jgi:hypothetical protein
VRLARLAGLSAGRLSKACSSVSSWQDRPVRSLPPTYTFPANQVILLRMYTRITDCKLRLSYFYHDSLLEHVVSYFPANDSISRIYLTDGYSKASSPIARHCFSIPSAWPESHQGLVDGSDHQLGRRILGSGPVPWACHIRQPQTVARKTGLE